MLTPRFTVRGLMLLVAGCSLALMVLLASPAWTRLFVTIILFSLGVTTLAAIYSRCKRRAFWLGFTFFAGGYMWLLVTQTFNDALVTNQWLYLFARAWKLSDGPEYTAMLGNVYYPAFVLHGHFVCAIVLGICGGLIARALQRRSERADKNVRGSSR